MNQRHPVTDEQVEPLVRSYLEHEAGDIDVQANLASIAARMANAPADATDPRTNRRLLQHGAVRWIARLAVAACLLVAVGVGAYLAMSPEPASAYALVRDAQAAFNKPADRCYRVQTKVPRAWLNNSPFLDSGEETLVWTHGDRFRVTTLRDGQPQVWGQDAERRFWIVCDPDTGIRFERDEVPPNFARTRAYLGLDVRRLTTRLIEQFDLQIEQEGRADGKKIVVVRAKARQNRDPQPINVARLEIEAGSKVIRKMELTRIVNGVVKGSFTFTLIEMTSQPESIYQLEANIAPGAHIYGSDDANERSERLNELLEASRGS